MRERTRDPSIVDAIQDASRAERVPGVLAGALRALVVRLRRSGRDLDRPVAWQLRRLLHGVVRGEPEAHSKIHEIATQILHGREVTR